MTRQAVSLEVIDIARPCPADWDEMRGDNQVRFCKHCSLNVYNLSAMTREAAERLRRGARGRLCIRMYRRLDGTRRHGGLRGCASSWQRSGSDDSPRRRPRSC
jgi:hypothetical protein